MAAANDMKNPDEVRLESTGGVASPQLVADLRALLDLPPQAQERLWAVLGPSLSPQEPANLQRELDSFERTFALAPGLLPRVLRAYRTFITAASLRAAPVDAVVADLTALTENVLPGRIVALGYPAATTLLRREAVRAALLEHGAVLDGVDWRVDHVGASSRGDGLRFGFGSLTLRYEEEGRRKRLTVQATPEMLVQLEAACRAMIGAPPAAPQARADGSTDRS